MRTLKPLSLALVGLLASTVCSGAERIGPDTDPTQPAPPPAPVTPETEHAADALAVEPFPLPEIPSTPEPTVSFALSTAFPEVVITQQRSFAYDRGMGTDITEITVAGASVDTDEVLEAVVRHRGGWGPEGQSADADILWTLGAYVAAWHVVTGSTVLTDPQPPVAFEDARAANPLLPAYHPPRTEIVDLVDGTRLAVYTSFERSFLGSGPWGAPIAESEMRTRFRFTVRAHAVADGRRRYIERADMPLAGAGPVEAGALPRPMLVTIPGLRGKEGDD